MRHRHVLRVLGPVVAVVVAGLALAPAGSAGADERRLTGTVEGGDGPLPGYEVTLHAARGEGPPVALAATTTEADGSFELDYLPPAGADAVLYVVARSGNTRPVPDVVTLAAVLGPEPVAGDVVVNPLTTVGTAYAMAQFTDDGAIAGQAPGLQNAAGMAHNLFDPATGAASDVLASPPNGHETETLRTFHSLANMVAACVADDAACLALLDAATPAGSPPPADSFTALDEVVQQPASKVHELFAVSELGPAPYQPARLLAPAAWTIALRFAGDGHTMIGPGNMAIDHEGSLWVTNNYAPEVDGYSCGSTRLLRFTPTGAPYPGSPYSGGGLNGAGFGITIDPYGDVWVGNFGFASPGCPQLPPSNSVSQFRPDGTPVSPDATGTGPGETGGWTQGGIAWPQGTVADRAGNVWIANCAGDSVTLIPDGDPTQARELTGLGLERPFDIAHDLQGNAYVTGTRSDSVAVLRPDGTPLRPPLTGAFSKPLGIAANSLGEVWVANSNVIDLPCPDLDLHPGPHPSVTHVAPDGTTTTYTGGGLTIPWGIAVDGHDNVWVANFATKRLSAFCGRDDSPHCPAGASRGTPLSPELTGFSFDGLVRNTGVIADTAGNVWLANNWLETAPQDAPGGHQMVAFIGLAGPVSPPAPRPRPAPGATPEASPLAPAAIAAPLPRSPRVTG